MWMPPLTKIPDFQSWHDLWVYVKNLQTQVCQQSTAWVLNSAVWEFYGILSCVNHPKMQEIVRVHCRTSEQSPSTWFTSQIKD